MFGELTRVLARPGPGAVPDGLYIVADAAFPEKPWLKKSLSEAQFATATEDEKRISNAMTSIRQGAEWSNASLTKIMRRLKVPMDPNPSVRQQVLKVCIHLHNARCRLLKVGQVSRVFSDDYEMPLTPRQRKVSFYKDFFRLEQQ